MAQIQSHNPIPPTKIDRFLGLNEDSSGDTQLQLGESPHMLNYRLTENFKLRKRDGYKELFEMLGHSIQGMWYGKINNSYHFLFAANGHVYEHDFETKVNSILGDLTDAETFFFAFGNKVYILNGHEYKSWNGTTFGEVTGYVPLVATATPPTGGGVDNEQINLLNGKKRQTFSPDGTAKVFQLRETQIDSVDVVKVDGVVKTVTTDYTVNLSAGTVTFTNAPTKGVDSADIQWKKGNGSRSEITENKFAMFFGGQNDTRVFLFGDGSNRYHYSGLANGLPSAEYFPAFGYNDIGSDEFQITDIVRQYDRQIIYTDGQEAWYSYYDALTNSVGDIIPDFPTHPLNDAIGNVAPGQAQLIQNNPFSIQNGVYEWTATNVRDERNAVYKSKRVQPSLDNEDLTQAITVDWEAKKEYWLAIGKKVWVYNYRLDAWYKYTLADAVSCFIIIDDHLYFGTPNGQIMKFDKSYKNDNGQDIERVWEMHFYDFDAEYLRKFLTELWISLKPEVRTSVNISFQTDRVGTSDTHTAEYNLANFIEVNFANWSFLTSYSPKPFRFKIKAKKFVYLKLIFRNVEKDERATILSLTLPIRYGSKVK